MLSGETAAGKYPVEALKMMVKIAVHMERNIDYNGIFRRRERSEERTLQMPFPMRHV